MTPEISINPARKGGLPCIAGTRIDVYTIAEAYQGDTATLTVSYQLTRPQVLLALWYCGTSHTHYRWLKKWAKTNHGKLWAGKYNEIEDPKRP